ncbi:MAG TPA: hypothetical protein VM328_01745 [Fimbriimonadaceae bacterium]|nr:hypothetical protein [Fimbriimonadaceae bacterium]
MGRSPRTAAVVARAGAAALAFFLSIQTADSSAASLPRKDMAAADASVTAPRDDTQATGGSARGRTYLRQTLQAVVDEQSILGAGALAERLLQEGADAGAIRVDHVSAIPDIDGDRRPDFVKLRYLLTLGDLAYDGTLQIRALKGTNARPLWTVKVTADEELPFVTTARLGKGGRSGIVVYELGATGSPASPQRRLGVLALGANGRKIWEHRFEPDTTVPVRITGVPLGLPSLMPAAPGDAHEFLIGLVTLTGTSIDPVHAQTAETSAVIIDGISGELFVDPNSELNWSTSPRPNVLEYQGDWIPKPFPAPDLSGDGVADYVYATALPRHEGRVSARDRVDGSEIWSNSEIPVGVLTKINATADLDRDGTRDLLLVTLLHEAMTDESLPHGDLLFAISGSDGTVLWSGTGGNVDILGDIDRDGTADIGTSSTFFGETRAGIRYAGLSGPSGNPLYSVAHTLPYIRGGEALLQTFLRGAGDVNEDGVDDEFYQQTLTQEGMDPQHASKIVSGRTGRKIADGSPWLPVAVSLDGRGDDLVRVATNKRRSQLEIAVADGRSNKTLWRVRYRTREQFLGLDETGIFAVTTVAGGPFSPDHCNDVAVHVYGRKSVFFVVLDGRDGSERWTLRLSGKGPNDIGHRFGAEGGSGC